MSKNIQVEKLRKILVRIFAVLSAIFACMALFRHFNGDCLEECAKDVLSICEWGNSIESLARKSDRLVFFYDAKNPPESTPQLDRVLKNGYIFAPFDNEAWPADYYVLDNLFSRMGGGKSRIKSGILTPKMTPLFLSASVGVDAGKGCELWKLLDSVRQKYAVARERMRDCSDSVMKSAERAAPSLLFVFTPPNFADAMVADTFSLYTTFFSPTITGAPTAVLSENARFVARLEDVRPSPVVRRILNMAALVLFERFSVAETQTEKLLLSRALTDFAVVGFKNECLKILIPYADSLVESVSPDGFILWKDGTPSRTRDNALAVSVLIRLYALSEKPKYLCAARKCANELARVASASNKFPALLGTGKNSHASSLGYVLTVGAFAQMHSVTGEEIWLKYARNLIGEWESQFFVQSGLCSINCKDSPFANLTRPVFFDDGKFPSYLGEAAQILKYLESQGTRSPLGEKLKQVAQISAFSDPVIRHCRASFKLALLPLQFRESSPFSETNTHGVNTSR